MSRYPAGNVVTFSSDLYHDFIDDESGIIRKQLGEIVPKSWKMRGRVSSEALYEDAGVKRVAITGRSRSQLLAHVAAIDP